MTSLRCIHDLVAEQVRRTPAAEAVVAGDQRVSYAELDRRANRLAHYLHGRGVRRGDLVVVFLERSVEMVVAILGVLKLGAAYVPVDTDIPAARMDFILSDTAAQLVLTQEALAPQLARLPVPVVAIDAERALQAQPDSAPPVACETSDLAYVMYTSGSTGAPKGVMVPHAGVANQLLWMVREYRLGEDDRVMQMTPYTFDVSVWELLLPLLCGAAIVMARPGGHRDPHHLAGLVARERVTTLVFVPSRLRLFLAAQQESACGSVRRVICIGEALPRSLQDSYYAVLSAPLFNLYGPTEASIAVTAWPCAPADKFASVPIGVPMDGVRCYVVDEQLRRVEPGEVGELAIGGVAVARGYLNRAEQTQRSFVPDPWAPPESPYRTMYRTGDLVREVPGCGYEYLGRNDDQVKLRGFRIELSEIENGLLRMPGVAAAVIAVEQDPGAEVQLLVAYLELHDWQEVTVATLRGGLAGFLPEYMIPQAFRVVDAFPLSANGKLDRKALKACAYRPLLNESSEAPRDAVEELLARAWSEMLRVPVGVHDDFFALGGNSLLAMRLAADARERGLAVTGESILTLRTVAAVARAADSGEPIGEQHIPADPATPVIDGVRVAVPGLNQRDLATLRQLVHEM